MRNIFVVLAVFSFSGCVSIEAPDHLVSDTIQAGKDAYYSVKENFSDKPTVEKKNFSYKYVVPNGESIGDSSGKCIDSAVESARKALNVYSVNVEDTTINSVVEGEYSVIRCRIVVGQG